jgi:thiamine pyrophosphate-dependent acetolactate synthase large subunit-like protein
MQNADFLLFLGTSLGAPVIGYDPQQFNPTAYKVYVDIEYDELNKDVIPMNWKIQTNIKNFFKEMS